MAPTAKEPAAIPVRSTGWETAALLFAATFPTWAAWVYFIRATGSPYLVTLYSAGKGIQFGFPILWLLVAERPSPGSLIARARRACRDAPWRIASAPGLLWGGGILALIGGVHVLVIRGSSAAPGLAAQVTARLEELGALQPWRFLLLALFLSLLHSFLEEYYWRWFLFGRLRHLTGAGPAILLSGLAFTGHHVVVLWYYLGSGPRPGLVWVLSGGVAAGGFLWAWLYHRYGTLIPGWISHVLADLAIMGAGYDLGM